MKLINITKGNQISAGNFIISIGAFNTGDIAIISKSTGDFTRLTQAKRSKKLRKIKRTFKSFINNDTTFNFQFMTDDLTTQLIMMLKSK